MVLRIKTSNIKNIFLVIIFFGSVIDEASFHTSTKDKDYAEESYNQLKTYSFSIL